MNQEQNTDDGWVGPKGTLLALDPRQERFRVLYFNINSETFGNCYKSALGAGFSDQTARNLSHNKPAWYSEMLGQMKIMEPEHLLLKLQEIINDNEESTQNRLKAIDMLMRYNGLYKTYQSNTINFNKIRIESVLD